LLLELTLNAASATFRSSIQVALAANSSCILGDSDVKLRIEPNATALSVKL
tara:strand:+ start:183 stop:335 length:153 start_codon:yes stop_codon:yes gene_type:complete